MFGLFEISTEVLIGYGWVLILLSAVILFGLLYVHSLVEGRTQKMIGYLLRALLVIYIVVFLSYFDALLKGSYTPEEVADTFMSMLYSFLMVLLLFMGLRGRERI